MANIPLLSSLSVFLLGSLFFLLAFSTPWWVTTSQIVGDSSLGLWQVCLRLAGGSTSWHCTNLDLSHTHTKLRVVQAFMCLTLFACMGSLVLFVTWLVKNKNIAGIGALGGCLVAGVLELIGVAVFGSLKVSGDLDWSFVLACCSSVIFMLDGIVSLFYIYRYRPEYSSI